MFDIHFFSPFGGHFWPPFSIFQHKFLILQYYCPYFNKKMCATKCATTFEKYRKIKGFKGLDSGFDSRVSHYTENPENPASLVKSRFAGFCILNKSTKYVLKLQYFVKKCATNVPRVPRMCHAENRKIIIM